MPYPTYQLPSWYKPDYHYLEQQIAKYERRIKQIEDNPDPNKLKSTKSRYEIITKELKDRLEAWKAGQPIIYSMGYPSLSVVMAVRDINLSIEADTNSDFAANFFKMSRGVGFPDSACDRLQVVTGMWRSGAIPPPSFVLGAGGSCSIEMNMVMSAISDFTGCPYYIIDRYVEPDGERLDYFVQQFREAVSELKKAIPEAEEFSEERLWQYLQTQHEVDQHMNVLWDAAKQVPCPVKGQDMFRLGRIDIERFPEGLAYYRERTAEIEERVCSGYSAVGKEKARCMWLVSGPFFEDSMSILENRGVSVPIFEIDTLQTMFHYGEGVLGDKSRYGRELSPLEEFARLRGVNTWTGPAVKWVDQVMEHIKEFKIDMLVYYMLSGCPTNSLAGRMVAETAEKEYGIPTLLLEGYMMDRERYDKEGIHAKINEFVDIVFARKGIKDRE